MTSLKNTDVKECEINKMDLISMTVPCKPEYVGVIRMTVSAIANRMGFNIEEIEDIKVAVAEACTNAIKHGLDNQFSINFEVESKKFIITILDKGKGCNIENISEPNLEEPKENGLGLFIIKTLMDEVHVCTKENYGFEVKMIKYLGDDV